MKKNSIIFVLMSVSTFAFVAGYLCHAYGREAATDSTQKQVQMSSDRERMWLQVDASSNDANALYILEYSGNENFKKSMIGMLENYPLLSRQLSDGRRDILPFLIDQGVKPSQGASATFDPANGTLLFIDIPENMKLVFTLFSPFAPTKYKKVKPAVDSTPTRRHLGCWSLRSFAPEPPSGSRESP